MGYPARSTRVIRRVLPRALAFCLILSTFLYFSGCATSLYLAKLGRGQARVILGSRSIGSVLEDPAVDESIKEKIRLVVEAKTYGEERIGLAKTSNFQRFYHVEGSSLLYVVSACPKDRLEPYQWWFPITGRVTVKGFFSQKDAIREKEKLERKGLDVFVQGAQAYSTLGWFKDPIFSTSLNYDRALVVHVVLHELTHNTVFFKDQFDFNEQIAFFVGGQGAVDFIGVKFGNASPLQKRAMGLIEDGVLFSRFIGEVFQKLKNFYSRPVSPAVKVRDREILFREAKEVFKILKKQLKTDRYLGFEEVKLNNAAILALSRYVADIEQIQRLYEELDRDLTRTVAFFKEIQKAGVKDPHDYVMRWLKARGLEGSIHEGEDLSVIPYDSLAERKTPS
ncbi:MAG: hypothetical protein GTO12_24435 [Proteobacteria bacterium]|nr:hypothetical protein [Pseudomonadota bacterium]